MLPQQVQIAAAAYRLAPRPVSVLVSRWARYLWQQRHSYSTVIVAR